MNTIQAPTLTAAQAAARLNIAPSWVGDLCTSGRIRAVKRGNRWHITEASLAAYIATRTRRGAREKPMPPIDAPLPRSEYPYSGVRSLVWAVLALAAEEAVDGDLPAQMWIRSAAAEHWFDYAGIDPQAAREAIISRSRPHPDDGRIKAVIALHERGWPWKAACMEVFEYYSGMLHDLIRRYAIALDELAATGTRG